MVRSHMISINKWNPHGAPRSCFVDRNVNASIDFVSCLPSEVHLFDGLNIPRVIFLLTRGRKIQVAGRQLLKIRHEEVRGVTTRIGHFPLSRCPPVSVNPTVRRTIGSVIEHKWHLPDFDNTSRYISPENLLPIDSLGISICLPSQLSLIYQVCVGQHILLQYTTSNYLWTSSLLTALRVRAQMCAHFFRSLLVFALFPSIFGGSLQEARFWKGISTI